MKTIIAQVILPVSFAGRSYAAYYPNGKRISAEDIRKRIGSFLRNNLTPDLALRRDQYLSHQHRLRFSAPCDFEVPSLRRSVRITSEMDAQVSEYAGIMQIPKRHVTWLAVVLEDSQHPKVLPLDEVLKQDGDVTPPLFDRYGQPARPVE